MEKTNLKRQQLARALRTSSPLSQAGSPGHCWVLSQRRQLG